MKLYTILATAVAAIVAQPAMAAQTFTFGNLTTGNYLLTYTATAYANPQYCAVIGGTTYCPSVGISLDIKSGYSVDDAIPNSPLHSAINDYSTTTLDATTAGNQTVTRTVPIAFDNSNLTPTVNYITQGGYIATVLFNGVKATFSSPTEGLYTITNVSLVAVPEPSSWALMIAGLGMAGATLRRRGYVARGHRLSGR